MMFAVVLRANAVLFKDWKTILHIDHESYHSPYKDYFAGLRSAGVDVMLRYKTDLCRAMLWRLDPVEYAEHTICRDLDSLPTLRERKAVEQWLINDTLAHSINDSVSHTIPLMGGMVGFKKNAFPLDISGSFLSKGSDQAWLNAYVYPKVQHSITEHRILGVGTRPENPFSYNTIQDIDVGLEEYKECDLLVNHIGQGGFHLDKVYNQEINKHYAGAANYWVGRSPICDELKEIEKPYKLFYWQK
jgi:hypothetical protein